MKNLYQDLIEQTFDFPQSEFQVQDNQLRFHDIPLMNVVKQFGSPLKLTYLPVIGKKISDARGWFQKAFEKHNYQGKYVYSYCTKSNHFAPVIREVLKHKAEIETSSAYDLEILNHLYQKGIVDQDLTVICNGYKRPLYTEGITNLINEGWQNVIPVLDNMAELEAYQGKLQKPARLGIRIASEEEPKFSFYTSRLGIRYNDIKDFFLNSIKPDPNLKLSMLHFFINTGIKDTAYYWNELRKSVNTYCELKKVCPELHALNIGGGFPIKTSLNFDYDYQYMVDEIVTQIKTTCAQHGVPEPDIYTEFGTYTVGEAGATLFTILGSKQQNDREQWYMIDSSFMTTLPDTWAIEQRFILLPLNQWDKGYQRINLGGLTCDSYDFYNWESHQHAVFLPNIEPGEELVIGFFHTAAYQDAVGGFGGIQHCLIPAPKHVIIDKGADGQLVYNEFASEQAPDQMMKTLGYT